VATTENVQEKVIKFVVLRSQNVQESPAVSRRKARNVLGNPAASSIKNLNALLSHANILQRKRPATDQAIK
jgi:hypothetical protein